MSGLLQMLILIGFLGSGMLLHVMHLSPPAKVTDRLIKVVLWLLLAVMGFRLGNSRVLVSQLGTIGLLAGATACLAVIGTVFCIALLYALAGRFIRRAPSQGRRMAEGDGSRARVGLSHFRGPGVLLVIVVVGTLAGVMLPEFTSLDFGAVSGWVLNALLFMIGLQFAQSGISLKAAFVRIDTLIVPLGTIIGTLAGGLAVSAIFSMSAGKGLALSAGFGWYSLSGVLITNLGDAALGSASFLANMMREALALFLIPLLARSSRPYTAIGVGGATAMDVTLPIVEQCCGVESVPVSFTSGAILSMLVPILVPLFYNLG